MTSQDHDTINRFVSHYAGLRSASDDTLHQVKRCLSVRKLSNGDCLVREGQYHPFGYFLIAGAVRSFYLKDGTEANTWFAFEEETVGSFQNYLGKPAQETLEVLEDSELIAIHLPEIKALANTDLHANHFVRLIVEEYALFLEEKLMALQMNATERYDYLLQKEPQVLQRIPLTYIASYLGITRETLSRIRAKK